MIGKDNKNNNTPRSRRRAEVQRVRQASASPLWRNSNNSAYRWREYTDQQLSQHDENRHYYVPTTPAIYILIQLSHRKTSPNNRRHHIQRTGCTGKTSRLQSKSGACLGRELFWRKKIMRRAWQSARSRIIFNLKLLKHDCSKKKTDNGKDSDKGKVMIPRQTKKCWPTITF